MSKVDICIVTPSHLSNNPRVLKEARALTESGYSVHVIHGHFSHLYANLDHKMQRQFTTTAVPYGPHFASRRKHLGQAVIHLASRQVMRFSMLSAMAAGRATKDLTVAAGEVAADLYIAHYVAALPAVAKAASHHGAQYAFDAEDFHPGDLPDTLENALENKIIRGLERRILPGAAYLTAASPGIAEAYSRHYGILRPTVVLNVFPKVQAPQGPTLRGTAKGPSLYWFSQTIGRNRGLECAIEALALARSKPHLYLRGLPAVGYQEALIELAEGRRVADRIHFLPPAEPSELERLASMYDVGLVGETGATHNRAIALTNKQFTYMLAGIPSVMSDVPAHVAFSAEAEGATFLYKNEDPISLAATLDDLLCNPDKLAEARRTAFRLGTERYNWDLEKDKLLAKVAEVLAPPQIK